MQIGAARHEKTGLITSAPASTYAAAAGGSLARKKDVLVHSDANGVTVHTHRDIGQGPALPWLNILTTGNSSQSGEAEQRGNMFALHGMAI